jgi:Fic family protein
VPRATARGTAGFLGSLDHTRHCLGQQRPTTPVVLVNPGGHHREIRSTPSEPLVTWSSGRPAPRRSRAAFATSRLPPSTAQLSSLRPPRLIAENSSSMSQRHSADRPCDHPVSEYQGIPHFDRWHEMLIDQDMWSEHQLAVEQVRAGFQTEIVRAAIMVAIRAAAADTGAIEGLYSITPGVTLAAARQEEGWESRLAEGGPSALSLFEAQLRAYEMAQTWAASPTGLSEPSLRQLQAELRKPETDTNPTIELGAYKTEANCVKTSKGIHRYAMPDRVRPDVRSVLSTLRSEGFSSAHPVLQASYAHYCLAAIHPFDDGNGRVARAVSSALLHRAVGLPLVVDAEQRAIYIAALEAADGGEWQPFIDFVFDCALDTMRFVADEVHGAPQTEVKRLVDIMTAHAGLTYQEVDTVSNSVFQGIQQEFQEQLQAAKLPHGTSFSISGGSRNTSDMDESRYRGNQQGQSQLLIVHLGASDPAPANEDIHLTMLIAKDVHDRFPLMVREIGTEDRFAVRMQDVRPETASYRLRRSAWVRKLLTVRLKRLADTAATNKAARGY